MTKTDIINEIVWEMSTELTREQQDRLKITFLVKMHDYELTEMKLLPAAGVHDNDWLLKRYVIQKVFQPTVEMQNVWDANHAEYVEKFAWIKRMLEM